MATHVKHTESEWVGGIVSMPAYVMSEGEPYRPEALFWMGEEGAVLGSTMGRPGEVLGAASASLHDTMVRPMWGQPHVPDRVRVASPELAAALRQGHPELDVVCAPTPELDLVFAELSERLSGDAGEESYLSPEIGAEAVSSFFRAAAKLFRSQPWRIIPGDQSLFSVTIEKLGVHQGALSIIGQLGESFGFILFPSLRDFEAFLAAARAIERGRMPLMPRHFALNFERGAELSPALRKEIAEHRWEVAGADAYPWLVAVEEHLVARPPTAREVTVAESIALALAQILESKQVLLNAWSGGEPVARTLLVHTHAGELEITLCAPYPGQPASPGALKAARRTASGAERRAATQTADKQTKTKAKKKQGPARRNAR